MLAGVRTATAWLLLGTAACGGRAGGSPPVDSGVADTSPASSSEGDASSAPRDASGATTSACPNLARALDPQGPYACAAAVAYVNCTTANGSVGCLSDGVSRCDDVTSSDTATCTDECEANQYAAACGGPPIFAPDGGFVAYEPLPSDCVTAAITPTGVVFGCCPCE